MISVNRFYYLKASVLCIMALTVAPTLADLTTTAKMTIDMSHATIGGKKLTRDQRAALLKSGSFGAPTTIISYDSGKKSKVVTAATITIRDKGDKTLTVLMPKTKQYMSMPAPDFLATGMGSSEANVVDMKRDRTYLGHHIHLFKLYIKTPLMAMNATAWYAADVPSESAGANDIVAFSKLLPDRLKKELSGAPLQMVVDVTSGSMGKVSMGYLVTALSTRSIPDSVFDIPSGYTRIATADHTAQEPALLANGAAAPEFAVKDLHGAQVKLSDFKGKVVVIDFWATWCGPCQQSLPRTNALAAKYSGKNVVVLGINSWDTRTAFKAWLHSHKKLRAIRFAIDPSAQGSDVASALYKVSGIPTQYVIGVDGKVDWASAGIDNSDTDLDKAIHAAIAGKSSPRDDQASSEPATGSPAASVADNAPVGAGFVKKDVFSSPAIGTVTDMCVDDKSGDVVAAGSKGASILNAAGTVTSKVAFDASLQHVCIVKVGGHVDGGYLVRGSWVSPAKFYLPTGKLAWTSPSEQGVDDCTSGDFAGNGTTEFVVGYNGGSGISMFKASGAKIWNRPGGNIWHVETAAATDGSRRTIVHSDAAGEITVRNADGHMLSKAKAPVYLSDFSLCRWPSQTSPESILVVEQGDFWVLGFDGSVKHKYDAKGVGDYWEAYGAPVRLKSGGPCFAALACPRISMLASAILFIFDDAGKLVYRETLPAAGTALAVLTNPSADTDTLLVGGENVIWRYTAAPPNPAN